MKLALILACVPACAWGDGEPFGAVTVTLDARWTLLDDRRGEWQRLASDYEVQVTAAAMDLGALSLIDVGTAALDFDPADPPPGYSLCHGGHCHADDGRLVPYEEIAAELSGGAPPAPVLVLPVGGQDLLPGGELSLDCDGPCQLPRAEVGRIELAVENISLTGLVRDTREPPRIVGEVAWTFDHLRAEDAPAVLGAIELPIDRGHDPTIALAVGFAPSAALLDGAYFQESNPGPWRVEADLASVQRIEEALGELSLEAAAARSD